MDRITIRVSNVGPIGFCRCVTPCTLAALRQAIAEQELGVPQDGYRFLSAGVTVSLVQEAGEDLMEGDIFIVALPPGSAAIDGTRGIGSPAAVPARAPSRSLLQQWVEAFGFMAPDCGEHSECGEVDVGECGPCIGNFITAAAALGHRDNSHGDLCQLDCSATDCAHGRWDEDIVSARVAGVCGCACSDSYGGDRCEFSCSGSPTCGAHGSGEDLVAGEKICTCCDGYVTGGVGSNGTAALHCRLAPTYVLSGATDSAYNGRYERLADHECLGAPVYQLGGSGGSVLYRRRTLATTLGDWYVGSDAFIADCRNSGFVITSYHGHCPDSPDDAGCAGTWMENVDGVFQAAPNLKVTAE